MPEDEARRPLLFGMSNGGVFEPVGQLVEMPHITSDANDEPYLDPSVFEGFSATVEADLEEFGDALAKLGNVNTEAERFAVMFECIVRAPRFRYVWQYKLHPKGRKGRRRRPRWMMVTTVLHDAEVDGNGNEVRFRVAL